VKNPIRNETSLVLVVAVIFSGVAIPVLSGFLEPSQPPAVAAVKLGDPTGGDAAAPKPRSAPHRQDADNSGGDVEGRRSASSSRERPAQRAKPAQAAPADDAGEDDDAD
jgi:hypothetical protein